jgi:hypothetical protein
MSKKPEVIPHIEVRPLEILSYDVTIDYEIDDVLQPEFTLNVSKEQLDASEEKEAVYFALAVLSNSLALDQQEKLKFKSATRLLNANGPLFIVDPNYVPKKRK